MRPALSTFAPGVSSRRRWLQRATGAFAAASLGLPAWAQTNGAAGKTLRLGYIGPSPYLTKATGWALKTGLLLRELQPLGFADVSLHVFPNGPDLNEAFISGAIDAGIYGDTPTVVAYSRGLAGRLIGFDEIGLNAWLLTPRGGVARVRDLDGQVVAVPLGSYMHRYVLGALKEEGILGRAKVVYMLPRDAGPALDKGSIAAFAAPIDTGPLLASQGFPVIDEAARRPHLRGTSVIVAGQKLLDATPGLPAAWQRARAAALREITADPERYYAFHAEVSRFPLEAVKVSHPIAQFPAEPYPREGLASLDEVKRFLLEEKLIRKDVDLDAWRVAEV
ncbi:MAG: putative aliphatic sulfonates-binding protein [Paracidovorax wautersii]|uniref:Putative aliphatic sulfonates-binding protein n=1 Tax=Paracidovorax wautersii TaxID=1177982 RepID=A0A7V8FNT7_9BURK|nr:MAG: putative aliphatic sulfonates-binding protein [Paracidovorax wautersii]